MSTHFIFGQKVFPDRRGGRLGERDVPGGGIDSGTLYVPDCVEGDDGNEDGSPYPKRSGFFPGARACFCPGVREALFVLLDLLFVDGFIRTRVDDPTLRTFVVWTIFLMVQIVAFWANFHANCYDEGSVSF